MKYEWLRAIPLAMAFASLPVLSNAQAMGGIGLDSLAVEAAAAPVTPASAPTFTQLSRPAVHVVAASPAPSAPDDDRGYLTLALAGLAALAFVSRRQRRAASQPVSAEPA